MLGSNRAFNATASKSRGSIPSHIKSLNVNKGMKSSGRGTPGAFGKNNLTKNFNKRGLNHAR